MGSADVAEMLVYPNTKQVQIMAQEGFGQGPQRQASHSRSRRLSRRESGPATMSSMVMPLGLEDPYASSTGCALSVASANPPLSLGDKKAIPRARLVTLVATWAFIVGATGIEPLTSAV